jgi:hypothetical protein
MIQKFILTFFLIVQSSIAFAVTADLNNPQGAVWNLREAGFTAEAQALENQLIEILKTAEINEVSRMPVRTSKAYLVRFPGGIYAVMKADDPDVKVSHRMDVASFVADRKIELNMVPITVAREFHGKNYSLQLYYPIFQNPALERTETEFATPRYWDLVAFDDLIANNDRALEGLHNVIIGIDGRLIAIDHSRTFRLDRYARIQNGIRLDKTSTRFKEGFAKAQSQDFIQGFEGLLSKDQISALQEKRAEMAREVRVRPQFGSPKISQEKPLVPQEFAVPLEMRDKVFVDLFGFQILLGPDSKSHPQAEINKLIERRPDQELLRTRALENWDYFSQETRTRILPHFFNVKDFAFDNSSFLHKVLALNPEFVFPMMAHGNFRTASFAQIARGLSRGKPEVSMTPEIRQVLRKHLVQGQLIHQAGFDFDELFASANDEVKSALLRELYQDLIKAGLQDHVAKVFRLRHLKNASLPPRLLEAFPVDQRPLIQAQLLRSYKLLLPAGPPDMQNESYKVISRLIGTMRRIPLSTPMCEGLF